MITSKQRSYLRKFVQELEPSVYIGKNGLTETVLAEMENSLDAHELVKVKLQDGCPDDIKTLAQMAAEAIGAEIVQVIGKKFSLYRKSEKNIFVLPR